MEHRRMQLMRWWQTSQIRHVKLLRAWLIRWKLKRLQIRDLLLAFRSFWQKPRSLLRDFGRILDFSENA
ncbi:unnamed protein product [Prunus armeniaca]